MHQREADGSLTPLPDMQLPPEPEVDMGGHGLHASIGEYMKFIRMWLNDGAGPSGRVLNAETVEMAVRNGLKAHQTVTVLPGVIASISNDAEFFPGLKKSWSYTFMVNDEDAPTGRPAGSDSAGLGSPNLFYWIDRKNGFGGYWATQILPFGDPISFGGYTGFRDRRLWSSVRCAPRRNAGRAAALSHPRRRQHVCRERELRGRRSHIADKTTETKMQGRMFATEACHDECAR